MPRRPLAVAAAVALGVGAFLGGRASVGRGHAAPPRRSYEAGYLAGREAAFGDFDGGWAYGRLYVVRLARGGPGITYRVARRWPVFAGVEYRACGHTLCSRRVEPEPVRR